MKQVTETKFSMKIIRIFNAQLIKIPHFKNLLTRKQARSALFLIAFFNVHIKNVNYASCKKRLIVEQFQGNYLKKLSYRQPL